MSKADYNIEMRDDCVIFKITRPHRLNAISSDVLDGLSNCIESLEKQTGNRGFILIGEGERAFCAGTDLFERDSMSEEQQRQKSDRARDLVVRLHRAPFVSIAALNGLAFGGGLELALACLFRIAAPHAECALPEVKLGLIPAYAGTQLLPAIVGPSRALDMMLTGRSVTSEEALTMGLINKISGAKTSLLEQTINYLKSINKHSKVAINAIRQSAAAAGSQLSDQGLKIERDYVVKVADSEDAIEGVTAFREKRTPQFKHR